MRTGLRVRTLPAVALLALLVPLTACGGDDSSVADPGGGASDVRTMSCSDPSACSITASLASRLVVGGGGGGAGGLAPAWPGTRRRTRLRGVRGRLTFVV